MAAIVREVPVAEVAASCGVSTSLSEYSESGAMDCREGGKVAPLAGGEGTEEPESLENFCGFSLEAKPSEMVRDLGRASEIVFCSRSRSLPDLI